MARRSGLSKKTADAMVYDVLKGIAQPAGDMTVATNGGKGTLALRIMRENWAPGLSVAAIESSLKNLEKDGKIRRFGEGSSAELY